MNENVLYLASYILTPLILLIAGLLIWRKPPAYFGGFGYNTKLSQSSPEAWDFAQVYFGRLMTIMSVPFLALSLAVGVIQTVMNVDSDVGFIIFCIVEAVQLLPLIVSIIVTQAALKKRFTVK